MGLKYIINSGSLPGIPARDLTDEEVAKFGKKFLLKSGLYEDQVKPDPKGKEVKNHGRN